MAYKKLEVLPQDVGAAIDALYKLRTARLAVEKEVELRKADEAALKLHIIRGLQDGKLEAGRGRSAMGTITRKRYAKVAEGSWPTFWEWARRDRSGSYVEKRAASGAVFDYMDTVRKQVPGIDAGSVLDLSITKAGR